METITFNKHRHNIPTTPDDLTPDQYQYLLRLFNGYASGALSLDMVRTRWFGSLVGLNGLDYKILKPERRQGAEELAARALGYFIRPSSGPDSLPILDITTVRNLLPEYRGYRGPGDLMFGVTFGQFVEVFTLMEQIETAHDGGAILQEVARILYHIPSTEPVPAVLAFHAPLFFGNVWHHIMTTPVDINGRSLDLSILGRKIPGDTMPDDNTGWTGVAYEVAASGIFGNLRQVEDADLWEVLLYLYKCKFEYIHQKQEKK